MQHIRSKNTVPELLIMNGLKQRKIYFARHVNNIIGKPDIVFRRKRLIIFIDSDFWHCNPELFIMPKTNKVYWKNKINGNVERDKYVNKVLKRYGWKVLRFWESDIKNDPIKIVEKIVKVKNSI